MNDGFQYGVFLFFVGLRSKRMNEAKPNERWFSLFLIFGVNHLIYLEDELQCLSGVIQMRGNGCLQCV